MTSSPAAATNEGHYFRLDLVQELVKSDEETGMVWFAVLPDPRRYDQFEDKGEILWRDKYLQHAFGLDVFKDMMKQAPGLPIYSGARNIEDSRSYSDQRQHAISSEHTVGSYVPPVEKPAPRRTLTPSDETRNVTFISVDICNSTKLRAANPAGYDKALKIALREMAIILAQFNGSILKFTGDGFIGFLDGPSINTQCDYAIDSALSILEILLNAVNPAGMAAGLPALSIRIGVDHGEATVSLFEIEELGVSEPEIASDALNRAVKIQEAAPTNSVSIGRNLYERIHVQWLERSTALPELEGLTDGLYRRYLVK